LVVQTAAGYDCGAADDLQARGRAEFDAGRYRSAARYFERFVSLCDEPSGSKAAALANAGQAYLELGERARAEEMFHRAVIILPQNAGLWHRLGQAQLQAKRYGVAEQSLLKALQLWEAAPEPGVVMALSDLAIVYQSQHRNQLTLEIWEKAVAASPPGQARARVLSNLGVFYWKLGQKQQARQRLAEALAEIEKAVGPNHPDVARILDDYSFVLEKTGYRSEARNLVNRARDIRTSFAANGNAGRKTVDWRDLK